MTFGANILIGATNRKSRLTNLVYKSYIRTVFTAMSVKNLIRFVAALCYDMHPVINAVSKQVKNIPPWV